MDYQEYRAKFFAEPQPEARFAFSALAGYAIYVEKYAEALAYYTAVLGQPNYIEGEFTHGWRMGDAWFTLFPAKAGGPRQMEVTLMMDSVAEAERLQAALIAAGGTGEAPSDELMYAPVRFCAVQDPFGTNLLIIARQNES